MVVAAVGTVFAAGYLLWMLQKVAFGRPKAEFADAHVHDVSTAEWIAWLPMLALIVVLGVIPNIMFHATDGAVTCRHDEGCSRGSDCAGGDAAESGAML